MHRYGLKLWSTNKNYLREAARLYDEGVYSYIELFVVPLSYDEHKSLWAALNIPFVIHAPHADKGLNLAKKENLSTNLALAEETMKYADLLQADTIIFHPGIEGKLKETVDQLRRIHDPRILIENKPYYGFNDVICVGVSPEDMALVMDSANVGFCLDIAHAFCAASAKKAEPLRWLERFLSLRPRMYHLTDGLRDCVYDTHDHLGAGDYDIAKIMEMLPGDAVITIETNKDHSEALDDFAKDVSFLNRVAEDLVTKECSL